MSHYKDAKARPKFYLLIVMYYMYTYFILNRISYLCASLTSMATCLLLSNYTELTLIVFGCTVYVMYLSKKYTCKLV